MENNFLNILFFPELILVLGTLTLLLSGLFIKRNSLEIISYLSIILLLVTGLLVYYDMSITFAFYSNFFVSTNFTIFFKLLSISGCVLCMLISINYLNDNNLQLLE